jgi:hypothetical protein
MTVPHPGAEGRPNIGPRSGVPNPRFTHHGIATPLIVSREYVKLLLLGDGKPYVIVFCGYREAFATTAAFTGHSDELNPVCQTNVDDVLL